MSEEQDGSPESQTEVPQPEEKRDTELSVNGRSNAAEIAGETIDVVGESTAAFRALREKAEARVPAGMPYLLASEF